MSSKNSKALEAYGKTVKSLLELIEVLIEIAETEPSTANNEFTIEDNNGGHIELSVNGSGKTSVFTITRGDLKLQVKSDRPRA